MPSSRVSATGVVEKLGITISVSDAVPVGGLLIVRSLYPTNEVGLTIGTASAQSWVDNIGLIRAAEMVIYNEMLLHTLRTESE